MQDGGEGSGIAGRISRRCVPAVSEPFNQNGGAQGALRLSAPLFYGLTYVTLLGLSTSIALLAYKKFSWYILGKV